MPRWTLIQNSTSKSCDASCRRSRRLSSKAARYRRQPSIRSEPRMTGWLSKLRCPRSERSQPASPICAHFRSWRQQIDSRPSQGFALCTMLIMKAVKSRNALFGHAFGWRAGERHPMGRDKVLRPKVSIDVMAGAAFAPHLAIPEAKLHALKQIAHWVGLDRVAFCVGPFKRRPDQQHVARLVRLIGDEAPAAHAATCELEGRRAGRSAGKSAAVIGCLSFLASFTNAGTRHAGT